jgi:hypothetical protein
MQKSKWLYKLEEDIDLDMPMAWSGFVRCNGSINVARREVAKKLNASRLPANTIVVSEADIIAGKQPKRITNRKNHDPAPIRMKAFADVGMTLDQAEDLLKQFGIK